MTVSKRYYYSIRSFQGGSATSRQLSAPTMSEVADKAFKLYKETWKKWPDMVFISRKETYTYN